MEKRNICVFCRDSADFNEYMSKIPDYICGVGNIIVDNRYQKLFNHNGIRYAYFCVYTRDGGSGVIFDTIYITENFRYNKDRRYIVKNVMPHIHEIIERTHPTY